MLIVDSGNSRVKWVIADVKGNFSGRQSVNKGESLHKLTESAKHTNLAVICNVASSDQMQLIKKALGQMNCFWVKTIKQLGGVTSLYDTQQLGVDRWCALLALRATYNHGVAVIVGTAACIDMLDKDGQFIGGLILPGRGLMHLSLSQNTQLPLVDLADNIDLPRNTADAVVAGSLFAIAGAVKLAMLKYGFQEDSSIVISGGDGRQLAKLLPNSVYDEDLVFRGIWLVYKQSL